MRVDDCMSPKRTTLHHGWSADHDRASLPCVPSFFSVLLIFFFLTHLAHKTDRRKCGSQKGRNIKMVMIDMVDVIEDEDRCVEFGARRRFSADRTTRQRRATRTRRPLGNPRYWSPRLSTGVHPVRFSPNRSLSGRPPNGRSIDRLSKSPAKETHGRAKLNRKTWWREGDEKMTRKWSVRA